ncbi:MAG: hypothetical protein JWR88_31, partial [Pseudonocardia sp.]|nr:hypothetical protein [Pseudonocardia sp.]
DVIPRLDATGCRIAAGRNQAGSLPGFHLIPQPNDGS